MFSDDAKKRNKIKIKGKMQKFNIKKGNANEILFFFK